MDMKKTITGFLALALVFAAGCQATPEAAIVTGKSSDELIEKAQADPGAGSLAARLGAPETYQSSFSGEGGALTVTVDAAVTVPDAEKVPILQVTPAEITQEQADVLQAQLARGALYSTEQPSTKEEIAAEILAAKQALAEGPAEDDPLYQMEGLEVWQQSRQDQIAVLEAKYDQAPETAEPQPISGQIAENAEGLRELWGEAVREDGSHEELHILNAPFGQATCSALFSRNAVDDGLALLFAPAQDMENVFQVDVSQVPDVTVTAEQAQTQCDSLAQALGIDGMSCRSFRKVYSQPQPGVPERCCWGLRYTRSLGGIPITYTDDAWVAVAMTPGGSYQAPWPYETLLFYVTDDGIVGLKWLSPYELGGAVTEDSALMPFPDVMDIFEKMYIVANASASQRVTVTDIRLGYVRVLKQDETGVGLLVPAWDFFGTVADENENFTRPDHSFLTINAVDGSIIDRATGY